MPSLEDVLNTMSDIDYLHDDIQFMIDENMRVISVPSNGVVAGVVGDKDSNRINFQMNRYYNGFDMSEFSPRIIYKNSNGDGDYYDVTDLTIEDDIVLFTWLIGQEVTAVAGTIVFVVKMIRKNESSIITNVFGTVTASMSVLESLDIDELVPPEIETDLITRLEESLSSYANELMEAYNNNIEQDIAEYNENAESKISEYNNNAASKVEEYDSNAETKVSEYDANAETKVSEYDANASSKVEEYDSNAETKVSEYDSNATSKTEAFDDNASVKMESYNSNASSKLEEYNNAASEFDINAETKLNAYNSNADEKTESFNSNATSKTGEFDSNVESKTNDFHDEVDSYLDGKRNSFSGEIDTYLAGKKEVVDSWIPDDLSSLIDDVNASIKLHDEIIEDANAHLTTGYVKTGLDITANLPEEVTGNASQWGVLLFVLENDTFKTGMQMYYPINGDYKGRVFTRSLVNMVYDEPLIGDWNLLATYAEVAALMENVTPNEHTHDNRYYTKDEINKTVENLDGVKYFETKEELDQAIENGDISEGDWFGVKNVPGEGSGSVEVDDKMSDESENPVQNKVVKGYVDSNKTEILNVLDSDSTTSGLSANMGKTLAERISNNQCVIEIEDDCIGLTCNTGDGSYKADNSTITIENRTRGTLTMVVDLYSTNPEIMFQYGYGDLEHTTKQMFNTGAGRQSYSNDYVTIGSKRIIFEIPVGKKGYVAVGHNIESDNIWIVPINGIQLRDDIFVKQSNPNLLINPDFKINQRGGKILPKGSNYYGSIDYVLNDDSSGTTNEINKATPTSNPNVYQYIYNNTTYYCKASDVIDGYHKGVYSVDRWRLSDYDNIVLKILDNGILVTDYISQTIENQNIKEGDIVTLSCKALDGSIHNKTFILGKNNYYDNNLGFQSNYNGEYVVSYMSSFINNENRLQVIMWGTTPLQWVKLELGSIATPFVPPNPAEELVKCQRYFYKLENPIDHSPNMEGMTNNTIQGNITFPVTMRISPSVTITKLRDNTLGSINIFNPSVDGIWCCDYCISAIRFNRDDIVAGRYYGINFEADAEIY